MKRVSAWWDRHRALLLAAVGCYAGWWLHDLSVMAWHGWLPYLLRTLPMSVALGLGWVALVLALGRSVAVVRLLLGLGVVLSVAPTMVRALGGDWPVPSLVGGTLKVLTALGLAVALTFMTFKGRGTRALSLCLFALGAGCASGGLLYSLRAGRLSLEGREASLLALVPAALVALSTVADHRWLRGLAIAATVVAVGIVGFEDMQRRTVQKGPVRHAAETHRTQQVQSSPNLVLIVLDTVSARHLRSYGYERSTMPLLDSFVQRHAITYMNARSAASWTLPSHATLFTGLMPAEHGAISRSAPLSDHPMSVKRFFQAVRPDAVTLAEQLSAEGYRTGAVVANASILHPSLGLERGFERFDRRAPRPFRVPQGLLVHQSSRFAGLGAKVYFTSDLISKRAVRWLDLKAVQPYFLFVNYLDAHAPLIPPDPFRKAFSERQPAEQLWPKNGDRELLYDREILGLDQGLFQLLSALEERDDFDETTIVITSDHGEAFGSHGLWGHGALLYEELLRVPLFVKPSRGRNGAKVKLEPMAATQVHAMMLSELGLASPNEELASSVSTAPFAEIYNSSFRMDEELVARRGAWLSGAIKTHVGSNDEVEIYDLSQDPHELINLANEEDRARWLTVAKEWWATRPWRPDETDLNPVPDPEAVRNLKALGYLGGH